MVQLGRTVTIKLNGAIIAGVRTRTITIDQSAIDVTTSDSDGFRELLGVSGERDVSVSVEGLTKDTDILTAATDGNALIRYYDIAIYPGITLSGDFKISNIALGPEYNDAVAFSAELNGTGVFVAWEPDQQMAWSTDLLIWQAQEIVWA
jgi:TP901-1 family phage major tail protein